MCKYDGETVKNVCLVPQKQDVLSVKASCKHPINYVVENCDTLFNSHSLSERASVALCVLLNLSAEETNRRIIFYDAIIFLNVGERLENHKLRGVLVENLLEVGS